MPEVNQWQPLYANNKGEVLEYPGFSMLARSGSEWVEPDPTEMMPLPNGATLVAIPNQIPVGWDGQRVRIIDQASTGTSTQAVAALLPQGFTRTLLPAYVYPEALQAVPILGYTAVGFRDGNIWVAAVQSDEHRKWHPRFYNTERLPKRIYRLLKKYPDNRIVRQLANCSLRYSCYTAQNLFYGRWEAGIPTMNTCNADCLGCISESHIAVDSPQQRLDFRPTVQEIYELGREHLTKAREGIISFGQGCEGEPALNAEDLAQAIRKIRQDTDRGTININSNAGYTKGIKKLCQVGLDALRVTMFSSREESYRCYHRPRNYSLKDVINSICYARQSEVVVSLNLLVFPGFTDREDEIESLLAFVRKYGVNMIQLRNLNIDAELLFHNVPKGGEALGIKNFISTFQEQAPEITIGSYTHPVR